MANHHEERPLRTRHFTIEEAINLQGAMIADHAGDVHVSQRPNFAKVTGYSRFLSGGQPSYALEVHWDHQGYHSDYADAGSVYFDQIAKGVVSACSKETKPSLPRLRGDPWPQTSGGVAAPRVARTLSRNACS